MPYFESATDRTRLHFVDYGPSDGPVVVFVAGSYFGTEMWEYQMLPLAAEGFRCVGFDRRGHGRSEDVWDGFDLDTLAGDLGALLDHLDLREVTLVGHSFGTVEAVRYLTLRGTERVARAVLVGGIAPGPARSADHPQGLDPELIHSFNETFRQDRAKFFADGADAFFARHLPGPQVSDAYVAHMVDRCHGATARAATALGEILPSLNLVPELVKIDCPVLVVHGSADASAPLALTGRRAAALVPGAELHVYEDAGHGLFATHAGRLNDDLRAFVLGRA
ncbi:alpha/beta hydrolase [Kitasatospora purpeofusca]|uniref:alpha/beta fold hydrolase n=1 Tax=Kitasatospora purpeofusca TaxID=67352 RepID=UPI002A5A9C8B|nr:alpha/beta hydrolase [Kitasatospora purpeofusca]MDY0812581.1 alpha/beta hydrolase [Kitasatospora purpeofusca]